MRSRPNLLFVMADQMRADALGVVNGWSKTPVLDQLAREGVLVRGVVASSAECVPSRLSLALGQYPHQFGVQSNVTATLDPAVPNWMQAISRAGYRTSVFGKTHLHPHEGDLREREWLVHAYGFRDVDETAGPHASASVTTHMTERWSEHGLLEPFRADLAERVRTRRHLVRPSPLGAEEHYDVYVGNRAVEYLESLPHGEGWFCWVSFGGPHEPWDAPEPYASAHDDVQPPAPRPRLRAPAAARGLLRRAFDSTLYSPELTNDDVVALRRNYAGKVMLIDEQMGRILDVVRRRGELDSTLVVFTSDHGEMNGDQGLLYKANFLDPVIQLPLIVRPPRDERMSRHRELDVVAELMDIGATLVDFAGGAPPPGSHARSLRRLLRGDAATVRSYAASEFLGDTAFVDASWKVELDPAGEPVLLFDRRADPDEQIDLVAEPRYAPVLAAMRERLDVFRRHTPVPAQRPVQ